jgi:HK97 family phage major capsid protein
MKLLKIRIKYFLLEMLAIAARPLGRMFYTKLAMFDSPPDEVVKALDRISAEVKAEGEKAIAEAKKGIAMAEGQKERVDELLLKQGELQNALKEVQQKQARAEDAGKDVGTKSIGMQAIENEALKGYSDGSQKLRKGQSIQLDVKYVNSAVGAGAGNVGAAIEPNRLPGMLRIPDRRFFLRDLIAPGRTDKPIIIYPKETGYVNNAAPVAEGARKPESSISMTTVTETVKKIATFMKASTEILADLPGLQSFIDYRLRYMLRFREEAQMLNGSGVGNNLNGIYTQATAYALPTGATAPTTAIDLLRLALLQAELAEFPSDGVVLNPTDWCNIELLKDDNGRYLIGNPQGTMSPTLWNRPVVSTQAMAVGQFLAGAFQLGAQVFDREDAAVVIATENEDDFVNNLVTVLIEERLGLAVYRPEAFVKGSLTIA